MEKAVKFRTIMNGPYRDHPSEDALERFLLNQAEEEELEVVESHILACESCVTRVETLDLNLKAMKLAMQNQLVEQAEKLAQPEARAKWLSWLTLPRLSYAGAALAACAFAITVSIPRTVNIAANRGAETTQVSEWFPLDLHLNANDLPQGPVSVAIVDARGAKVWQGEATVQHDKINVKASRLTSAGQYFVRVYSQTAKDAESQLLREFSIQAKPLF